MARLVAVPEAAPPLSDAWQGPAPGNRRAPGVARARLGSVEQRGRWRWCSRPALRCASRGRSQTAPGPGREPSWRGPCHPDQQVGNSLNPLRVLHRERGPLCWMQFYLEESNNAASPQGRHAGAVYTFKISPCGPSSSSRPRMPGRGSMRRSCTSAPAMISCGRPGGKATQPTHSPEGSAFWRGAGRAWAHRRRSRGGRSKDCEISRPTPRRLRYQDGVALT
jgi:hypothetical protein